MGKISWQLACLLRRGTCHMHREPREREGHFPRW
jgi:hypothetical protein